jgi:hypothetical protein
MNLYGQFVSPTYLIIARINLNRWIRGPIVVGSLKENGNLVVVINTSHAACAVAHLIDGVCRLGMLIEVPANLQQ